MWHNLKYAYIFIEEQRKATKRPSQEAAEPGAKLKRKQK
jgi:hypothetical protein